jgi:hypothetical protein
MFHFMTEKRGKGEKKRGATPKEWGRTRGSAHTARRPQKCSYGRDKSRKRERTACGNHKSIPYRQPAEKGAEGHPQKAGEEGKQGIADGSFVVTHAVTPLVRR